MLRTESTLVAVSVVIAAFNSAKYIRETLESVLAETCPPPEIIMVDDGSTDETAAIVRYYTGRVKLLQQAHKGGTRCPQPRYSAGPGKLYCLRGFMMSRYLHELRRNTAQARSTRSGQISDRQTTPT